jgi:hypothetical protein
VLRARARPSPSSTAAGFSVLELVAVLAASALIGSLGFSAYRTYAVRAKVAASLTFANHVRARVAAAFKATGIPPADRHAAGLFEPAAVEDEGLVDSIDVADGRISITFSARADSAIAGQTLYLTPFETADLDVVWVCGNKPPGDGLKPLGFAAGGPESVQASTTIDARFLPSECR